MSDSMYGGETMRTTTTSLNRLVGDRRYEHALEYLETHPEEISLKDRSNKTPLLRICQEVNPGPHAVALVQAMVNFAPQIVKEKLPQSKTLLHEAVSRSRSGEARSTDLALVLINANPAIVSVKEEPWKMTPFHTACDADADIVVLKRMLFADAELSAQMTKNGKTPMDILLRKNGWNLSGPALDKVALLLLTNFNGRVVDPLPMHHMVHAACCYPRPLTFLTRIMKMFPEQISQPDDEGYLPLHYAVRSVGRWDDTQDPFMHSNFVFQKLMKLVKAAPQTLHTVGPDEGLYPALMSATQANECTIHLSVTYQLLLAAPEIISQAIPNDNDEEEADNGGDDDAMEE
jgi:hypothetical protein